MNDAAHRSDRPDRFFGVNLDGGDFQTDIFGGFSCLLGEFFDFVGDDRETLAGFACAGLACPARTPAAAISTPPSGSRRPPP